MANQHVLQGQPPIPLILRRSARARRISLRISSLDGRVTLTLPTWLAEGEALDFAHSKEGWIRKHLAQQSPGVEVRHGVAIPVSGALKVIVPGTGRRVRIGAEEIAVPGTADQVGARLGAHLKTTARAHLANASDHYAAALGKSYSRLTLRDTRSRWGSCSSEGALMYSWRLIMAPTDVLNYVAAHEVAHLAEMNHSPAFWAGVERLYGPYKTARNWLRQEGNALHRYRF